jgi:hypothetical protein
LGSGMEKEKKHIVLSTIVERELYEKILSHCANNSLTPSSLIRDLLIQEVNGKQSLTTIYNEIMKQFLALQELTLMSLETVLELSIEHTIEHKNRLTIAFQGRIPTEYLDVFQGLDRYLETLGKRLKDVRERLDILRKGKKKEAEKET